MFLLVLDSLPPTQYKEKMSTILLWIQESETKLAIPQVTVTECEIMEQRLRELKVCNQMLLFYIVTRHFAVLHTEVEILHLSCIAGQFKAGAMIHFMRQTYYGIIA